MIVTDLKTTLSTSKATLTPDGYPIVGGYTTFVGTNISSPQLEAYEVRPASLVLSQGQFNEQSFQAGNAGSVSLTGNTTILNGTIGANPLSGYPGGLRRPFGEQRCRAADGCFPPIRLRFRHAHLR